MPVIFINPSIQADEEYFGGGNDQHYMNRIADAMVPYLRTNGIRYTRSKQGTSLGQSIRDSNAGYFDLHIALRSNASPENLAGRLMGVDVFYYSYGARSKRAAEIVAENYKRIYPNPVLVKAVPTNRMPEVTKTNAPAVLVETAYHDNENDVQWLKNNIEVIAANLVEAITKNFAIPFISKPQLALRGTIDMEGGNLNIFMQPDRNAQAVMQAPNGAAVTILGLWQNWYVVDYKGNVGYADAKNIMLQ